MTKSANPLKQFFRQPAIFLKLPENGRHWPAGSLEMPPNGELPIYPMTAIDEIAYRTPDALFNGAATVSVIESCVPGVKDAWKTPSSDLNRLLVGIRIASYGNKMELNSICPACTETNEFELDLNGILSSHAAADYAQSIRNGDIEIYFKPISYDDQNKINLKQFEQQRILQAVPGSNLSDEEKSRQLNKALQEITKITITAVANNIGSIRTPQALVTEPEFIEEFLSNCDRKFYAQVRDHVVQLRTDNEFKPLKMTCGHCKHEYQQEFTLDSTNFFDNAS